MEPPKRKGRVLKRKQWSEESMLGAIKAVQEGTLGVNRAALEFAVPKTTLKDRLSGRVIHGSSCGARPYLSKEEEKELVNFITTCSKMGYGKTRKEVLALVEAAIEKKGRELKNPISLPVDTIPSLYDTSAPASPSVVHPVFSSLPLQVTGN